VRVRTLSHVFVDEIPSVLDPGVVYISLGYGTVAHLCCCGCSNEVVTPLSPVDWSVTFDGETVSLNPSIGNWGLPCRSHYWIDRGRVRWARSWSDDEIAANRARDRSARVRFFGLRSRQSDAEG